MHGVTSDTERLAAHILKAALERRRSRRLGAPQPAEALAQQAGQAITPDGIGWERALQLWTDVLDPATVAIDHPRYMAFVGQAPTEASIFFDLLVSASAIYAGSWLEAAGAVYAENQALRWLADLAGFPPGAGGTFVPGGTLGNLSALHAARHVAASRARDARPPRWRVIASVAVHSSVAAAARILDVDLLVAPVDERDRLTGEAIRKVVAEWGDEGVVAVVASAGATNAGAIDDLAGIAEVCQERGWWLHVDGAYGLAALAAPGKRAAFAGIEKADSFIVDPHKWFFGPYDCCALIYREPAIAAAAHTQHAAYLEAVHERQEWNPSDYAVHLTRRARGLPFWFSLVTHGTRAYASAIEATLETAQQAAEAIRARPYLELLLEPELTVLLFRRRGWGADDYDAWSARLLAEQIAFVMPTRFQGAPAGRLCIVNPRTTIDDIACVLDTME
jgi:glutamate/tyrosine decarboxylase-like PLP-dependent enzyme